MLGPLEYLVLKQRTRAGDRIESVQKNAEIAVRKQCLVHLRKCPVEGLVPALFAVQMVGAQLDLPLPDRSCLRWTIW